MKRTILGIPILLLLIAGCSKDPLSTTVEPRYRLIFNPDTLRGEVYHYYSLKARVEGLSEADVYLNWELAGASTRSTLTHWPAGTPITDISYLAPGTYKIVARAYDNFNDTLIATDSTLALIDTTTNVVDLLPHSTDTSVEMNADGSLAGAIEFTVSTGASSDFFSYGIEIKGNGFDTLIVSPTNAVSFVFPSLGTYTAIASVLDAKGQLYGRASTTLKIRMPSVTLQDLQRMRRLSVFVRPDNLTSIYDSMPTLFALAGHLLIDSNGYAVQWDGTSCISTNIAYDPPHTAVRRIPSNDSISVDISGDLTAIPVARMSLRDTAWVTAGVKPSIYGVRNWSCSVQNLTLHAVTPNAVVYWFSSPTMSAVIQNFRYGYAGSVSDFDEIRNVADQATFQATKLAKSPVPTAIIIFTR